MFFFRSFGHVGSDRTNQPVAQQDAEKSPDQCGSNFFADFLRRPAECSHRDDHAKYGGDNSEAGQRVSHGAQRGRGLSRIPMLNFHVEIEHLIEVERAQKSLPDAAPELARAATANASSGSSDSGSE